MTRLDLMYGPTAILAEDGGIVPDGQEFVRFGKSGEPFVILRPTQTSDSDQEQSAA